MDLNVIADRLKSEVSKFNFDLINFDSTQDYLEISNDSLCYCRVTWRIYNKNDKEEIFFNYEVDINDVYVCRVGSIFEVNNIMLLAL